MNDLFGNEVKPPKVYKRDSIGRFADEKTAKYERALTDAAKYKQMYLAAQSRFEPGLLHKLVLERGHESI